MPTLSLGISGGPPAIRSDLPVPLNAENSGVWFGRVDRKTRSSTDGPTDWDGWGSFQEAETDEMGL